MKINHNLKSFGAQAERTNLVQEFLLIVDLVLFLFTFFTSFLGIKKGGEMTMFWVTGRIIRKSIPRISKQVLEVQGNLPYPFRRVFRLTH